MPFVKQIALGLNLAIPLYFFWYQVTNKDQEKQKDQDDIPGYIINILTASIVLLSPLFHILALLNPSYCYKGHCPIPHHCTKSNQEITKMNENHTDSHPQAYEQKYNEYNKYDRRDHLVDNDKVKFNDDLIHQSQSSSKEDTLKYDKQLFKSINKQSGTLLRLQKMQPPPKLNDFSISQSPKIHQSVNIDEFSNIPFFGRTSRKSLGNGGNESPRHSRKSIVQVPQSNIVEPLIQSTPRKSKKQEKDNKQLSLQQQNKYGILSNTSSPYAHSPQKSSPQKHSPYPPSIECEYCQQCHLPKYLRMKHCYRCSKCVHKYDHHCVLLNICIGEMNQKHYIAFLYAHLYNTVLVLKYLLEKIKDEVWLDESTGIEHIGPIYTLKALGIIVLLLNSVLTGYLVFIHTKFLFNGSTTYEKERRQTINYFKHIKKYSQTYEQLRCMDRQQLETYHPFNQGIWNNVKNIIVASDKPYDWKLPFKESVVIEMKDRKQMAKGNYNEKNGNSPNLNKFEAYEWGEESESSNNLYAAKTTKSRESAHRKSKEKQHKHQKGSPSKI